MGYLQKAVVGLVMASLCLSVLAAEDSKAKVVRSKIDYSKAQKVEITEKMRANFAMFIESRRALLGKSETCVYQTGGVCVFEIPVILVPDPAKPADIYCVAVFPEEIHLPGTAPGSNEKTIVWSLTPPVSPPANTTFTFFDKPGPGIIVLSDGLNQLKNGALGDGTPPPVDKTKYRYVDKHNLKHNATNKAVYLPIVVRTDNPGTASEKISVCGTPDPTILND